MEMRNAKGWCGLTLGLLFATSGFGTAAWAQSSVTPEQEYQQLVKVNQDIQPLGANPFGENISPYDGALSFEETDVSLPGTGPVLQHSHELSAGCRTTSNRPQRERHHQLLPGV
jgi:hypothetical protein